MIYLWLSMLVDQAEGDDAVFLVDADMNPNLGLEVGE